eukprot:328588-Amphidinium_carterae.1
MHRSHHPAHSKPRARYDTRNDSSSVETCFCNFSGMKFTSQRLCDSWFLSHYDCSQTSVVTLYLL